MILESARSRKNMKSFFTLYLLAAYKIEFIKDGEDPFL
jgi:hypothetical protein